MHMRSSIRILFLLVFILTGHNISAAPKGSCNPECVADLKKAAAHTDSKQYQEALQILEKYCDADIALSCYIAAQINTSLNPAGRELIQKQYEKACEGGYERGCYQARGRMPKKLYGFDLDELVIDSGKKEVLDKERIKLLKVKNNSRVLLKHKTYINQTYPTVNLLSVHDTSMVQADYGFIKSIALRDEAKLKISSGNVGKIQIAGNNLVEINNHADVGHIYVSSGISELSLHDAKIKRIEIGKGTVNMRLYGADIDYIIVKRAQLNITAKNGSIDTSGKGKYLQYTAKDGSVKRAQIGGVIENVTFISPKE